MPTLRAAFESENIKPVRDAKTTWLRIHRPSVAFLLCVCSGPWKIGRRRSVQEAAIKILGKRDLTELTVYDMKDIAQVEWQFQMLASVFHYFHIQMPGMKFDTVFSTHNIKANKEAVLEKLLLMFALTSPRIKNKTLRFDTETLLGNVLPKLPKVIGMFVRDFLFYNVFPVDRHVRRWMKAHGLPSNPVKVLEMFRDEKLQARYYARALFLDKAGNPMHKATKRV